MSLLDRLQQFAQHAPLPGDDNASPLKAVIEHLYSATEGSVNGRRTILVGTNNYLGLTFNDECINASNKATRSFGTGTTGSRLANGSYASHTALEKDLAEFYGVNHSIVFSTGYTTNLGMISSLVGPGDTIMLDEHCHASIYDGCMLSGADIIHFRHNNAADLDKRMQRLGDKDASTLIIVEGIYSMLGDRGNIAELVEVKQKYDALLLVDEAHSLGVLGETGRGLCQEANVEQHVDFITGTFSKSLAGIGGFCTSQHQELEVIRYRSRPYIFTASPSPATIASTRAALKIIESTPGLRKQLWENATMLYQGLQAMGFDISPEISPVIAVSAGSKENALAMWTKLFNRGIYVNLVLPPATPNSKCLLRCSVSAAHTRPQLEIVLEAFSCLQSLEYNQKLA
jgi:8-amino-7-oxononanoate synthase